VYRNLDDADLGALVAYLRTTRVDRRFEPTKPGPIGRALRAAGKLDAAFPYFAIDHAEKRAPAPPAGATPEYGAYLARTFGCPICHGTELSGGPIPGNPKIWSPNVTPGGPLKAWNEELFLVNVAKREGEVMPWKNLRLMTDEEQRALWRYLASLPARASVLPPTG
jgi:cytochrome c5